ncbi:hypothetical protein BJI67_15805 (plasmid) [Acidihalobacter aeolianus]|uniref:THIF-type NAD/FAD binding fold domain-containing protein n=2 Tax=Acidihalobacter aeolianus TaxID=2792603 RepID=A0A1D8KD24_9GAMM|nr:hypothetical protein BJI67_15805 [Acidihalobacter aeolianus]
MTFDMPARWIDRPLNIVLLGAGGAGSEVFDGLVRLHKVLNALDHPGLRVTVYDGDSVSPSNTVRQRFFDQDVGENKATLLVHRANVYHGLSWAAVPEMYVPEVANSEPDLLIGCVDSAAFRVALHDAYARTYRHTLWLDLGNDAVDGQCVLGHLGRPSHGDRHLPNVVELFPTLRDTVDDNTPSCSAAEALRSQDAFINRTLADAALNLLYRLLRDAQIQYHGSFVNVKTGEVRALPIDPTMWAALGYTFNQWGA